MERGTDQMAATELEQEREPEPVIVDPYAYIDLECACFTYSSDEEDDATRSARHRLVAPVVRPDPLANNSTFYPVADDSLTNWLYDQYLGIGSPDSVLSPLSPMIPDDNDDGEGFETMTNEEAYI